MIHFKEANIVDIPLIQSLAKQTWYPTYVNILTPDQSAFMMEMMYSTDSLQQQMNVQQHHFILCLNGETAVGFASWSELPESNRYKLHKCYVSPEWHGQGVGRKMIEQVIIDIASSVPATIELNVNRHNNARDFYHRLGFTVVREEDIAIGNGYFMNDYVMQKQIGGCN